MSGQLWSSGGPYLPGEVEVGPSDPILSQLTYALGRSEQRTLKLARAVLAMTTPGDDLHESAADLIARLEP